MSTDNTTNTKVSFDAIEAFLRNSGWRESKQSKTARFFSPPNELGLLDTFSLGIPLSGRSSPSSNLIYEIAEVLEDLYGRSLYELLLDVEQVKTNAPWLLRSRLIGEEIGSGTIKLSGFENYISQVTKSFYEVAKFNLGADGNLQKVQAQKFLDACEFQPTEKGSFVTSIAISNALVREDDLVTPSLDSHQLASGWFSAVRFLNSQIIQGDSNYVVSDEAISESLPILNIPLVESLRKLIGDTRADQFDFELHTHLGTRASSTGHLSPECLYRLDLFVKTFRERLTSEDRISVSGQIIELRSRDPSSNRNYISIRANVHGDWVIVAMTLTNDQYQDAIQAHRRGRSVRVTGQAIRLITQLRMKEIESFEIL